MFQGDFAVLFRRRLKVREGSNQTNAHWLTLLTRKYQAKMGTTAVDDPLKRVLTLRLGQERSVEGFVLSCLEQGSSDHKPFPTAVRAPRCFT